MIITVECEKRPEGQKPKALRRNGQIPANLYGHEGTNSLSLVIDAKTVSNLLRKASVNNTLIDLKVKDASWQGKTLLREVQAHPAKGTPYHLSFFAVAGHGDTTVEVPVRLIGEAAGVKLEGGIVDAVITELQVSCPPEKIPEAIEVDVTSLKVGDSLHIHELVLPEGITVQNEPERVVVTILSPRMPASGDAEETTETEADSAAS